ncbi:MAG: hypothetical protein IJM40_00565 [Synergistaceae bacterium]|nr:hypothetical protein [Synergistaceae bacterium]
MALDDIFIDEEDESKLPELVRLRLKRGWSQGQMAVTLGLNIVEYSDVEYERIKKPEVKAQAKAILESGVLFNPYIFLARLLKFKPHHEYNFIVSHKRWGTKGFVGQRILIFIKPCKGAHGVIHYLFKDKGGSLESFTQVQLTDYKISEVI